MEQMYSKPCGSAASFWKGKSVFLTGHTGFKGGWLSLWLQTLGARVTGYALAPPSEPNLFQLAGIDRLVFSVIGDIRDGERLGRTLTAAEPEIVIHMAAQPLVRESYQLPVETYATNVMGTVNLLEAVRHCPSVRVVVNVTTDKCYDNRDPDHAFGEDEPLGGYDPYSNSKACSELVTAAWRSSYFNPAEYDRHKVAVATARAGNVIGGGDWARDRLIPDCISALTANRPIRIRNPQAVRPWQHVLEPLSGYMLLARRLYEQGCEYAEGWNFGPDAGDCWPVERVVRRLCEKWGEDSRFDIDKGSHPHEAGCLRLDITKAKTRLGWQPRWGIEQALNATIDWVQGYRSGNDAAEICRAQIEAFTMTGRPHTHCIQLEN